MYRLARLALFCLTLFVCTPAWAGSADGRFDIYFIDVEGGAAMLAVTPEGESLLIDSGYPDLNFRDRDRILAVVRDELGLKKIDHVAVSHWHLDHYGNHASLASEIKIGTFWDRGIPDALQEDKSFHERIANYRAASQNRSKALKAGDMLPLKSGSTPLSVKIVTSSRDVIPNTGKANPFAKEHKAKPEDKSDNAASLSMLFQFGDFKFLACGDLTWNVEAKLMTPNNPLGQVDLFMVTHHGLPVSNNPALVLAIDPVVTVMCNGPTKGGHADTLATLKRIKSNQAMFQLHRNVKLDDAAQPAAEFILNSGTTADCEGGYVHASIAADGSSYRLKLSRSEKWYEFKTRGK